MLDLLLAIPPAETRALELAARLLSQQPPLTIPELLAMQAELARETENIEGLRQRSRKATERCLALPPIPARHLPAGF